MFRTCQRPSQHDGRIHDGSIETLDEAVRVMVELQIGVEMTEEDVANLVAFLGSLTGELPEAARSLLATVAGR